MSAQQVRAGSINTEQSSAAHMEGQSKTFVDNRPQSAIQRKQADMIASSPRVTAQRAMHDSIHRSQRMDAQRELAAKIGGGALHSEPNATSPVQRLENSTTTPNRTGLPDQLKSGVESLSGMSLDHVNVHYNSSKPAQLNAHAYAQGSDIHVGPGQEKHLPHEAWHVVQQAQGRVTPTAQLQGQTQINDDKGLEAESDAMGKKALALGNKPARADIVQVKKIAQNKSPGTLIVQRYKAIGTDEYALGEESDSEYFFTTQSVDPSVKKKKGKEYEISHDIDRNDAKQNLLIADDGSVAINHSSAHAKEFYATDAVFNAAQKKLKQVKSEVKLVKSGGLNLTAKRKTLSKVVPEAAKAEGDDKQKEFANLVSHICIEMASGVMGNASSYSHEAVFQKAGDESETVVNITSGMDKGDSNIERLATALTDAPKTLDPKTIRNEMLTGKKEELPGKRYGTQAGHKQLDKKAKQLGVNQYANPDVGEGYATFSLAGSNDKQIDYLKTGDEREILKSIWGYHFATVVAKSLDGKDTITLENYNRSDDVFGQLKKIIDRLIQGNGPKFKSIVDQVKPGKDDSRTETQQKLQKALQVARNSSEEKAQNDFTSILQSYNAIESWFFAMQGSGKGQSFHEQQAQSDAFVNPLTLRVRPRDKRREELRKESVKQIGQHPAPPARLAEQPAFSEYAKEKSAIVLAIENAESEADIKSAFNSGKDQLAIFTVNQAIEAIGTCATQSGVQNFEGKAKSVGQRKKIAEKFVSAIELGMLAHSNIEDKIQELWIFEVEKHMNFAMNQVVVFDAIEYLRSALDFYRGK